MALRLCDQIQSYFAQFNVLPYILYVLSVFHITRSGQMSESDMLVGQLLRVATYHCPQLAKSWFALAGWCYKWGRKAVDATG